MQTLHVRSVPDDLYNQIKDLARNEQRSLSAQVVVMLTRALKLEVQRQEQSALLDTMRRRRFVPPKDAPDPVAMLREDRAR